MMARSRCTSASEAPAPVPTRLAGAERLQSASVALAPVPVRMAVSGGAVGAGVPGLNRWSGDPVRCSQPADAIDLLLLPPISSR